MCEYREYREYRGYRVLHALPLAPTTHGTQAGASARPAQGSRLRSTVQREYSMVGAWTARDRDSCHTTSQRAVIEGQDAQCAGQPDRLSPTTPPKALRAALASPQRESDPWCGPIVARWLVECLERRDRRQRGGTPCNVMAPGR